MITRAELSAALVAVTDGDAEYEPLDTGAHELAHEGARREMERLPGHHRCVEVEAVVTTAIGIGLALGQQIERARP